MAHDKSRLFPVEMVELAEFAKGVGHPARIRIVSELMKHPEGLCCGDLVARSPLAQSTVSQHIRALQRIGLLESRQVEARVHYRLRTDRLRGYCHALQETFSAVEVQDDGFGETSGFGVTVIS